MVNAQPFDPKTAENYRIYGCTEEKGVTKDGGKLEWQHGCNGECHVDLLIEVFYDQEGEVTYATNLVDIERGPCDHTCGTACKGKFLYS